MLRAFGVPDATEGGPNKEEAGAPTIVLRAFGFGVPGGGSNKEEAGARVYGVPGTDDGRKEGVAGATPINR